MSLLLILASAIWGINVIVMKIIMESLPMYLVAGVRVICSSMVMGIFLLFKKQKWKISKSQFWKVLMISFFNVGLNFYLSFTGIHLLKGTSTALINALTPVITYLFSWILLKQKESKKTRISMVLSILGFMISMHFDITQISLGTGFLLASIASYAVSIVLIKKWCQDIPIMIVSFYSLVLGAIQLLLLSYIQEGLPISLLSALTMQDFILFFGFSICGFAFVQYIHLQAITTIGPVITSFYLNLNPIFTYITAIIFLREQIQVIQLVGFTILFISLLFSKEEKV